MFVILWIIYKHILLANAKKKHIDEAGYIGLGRHGEGRIEAKAPREGMGRIERIADVIDVVSGERMG